MKMLPLILALTLVGCATPEPIVVTKEVKIPVAVPCVDADAVPPVRDRATAALSREDDLRTKVAALATDLKVLEADDRVLRALVQGCSE